MLKELVANLTNDNRITLVPISYVFEVSFKFVLSGLLIEDSLDELASRPLGNGKFDLSRK